MKKELRFLKNKFHKDNFKKGSNILLKVFIPELDLNWDDLYFFMKDKKDNVIKTIKKNNHSDNVV